MQQSVRITFGMVSNSEVPVVQSHPVFVIAEVPGTGTLLFCMLSNP